MRKILCTFIILKMLCLNSYCQSNEHLTEKMEKLGWLEGTWSRTNNKAGQSGYEKWTKASLQEFRGIGVTLRGTDTLFIEKLRIVTRGNDLYYVADVPENQKPVYFKFTKITLNGFVCQNPEHDFPKKISYVFENNQLKATISGNGKSTDYLFERR